MSTLKQTKINRLINNWPRGTVMTQNYLTSLGYDANLLRRYRESGWVRSFGTGVFALANDQVDWQGGLFALQHQLNLNVHVGGKTAIEQLGGAHYARFKNIVYLFAPPKTRLPKWFKQADWQSDVVFKNTAFLPYGLPATFTEVKHKSFSLRVAAMERAVLEMLYFVPDHQGCDEAMKIMDNMLNLRPRLMQGLLENCHSVKVKRLCLYMADKNQLPWTQNLDRERISLGKGKRVVSKNGILDNRYLITVPKQNTYD